MTRITRAQRRKLLGWLIEQEQRHYGCGDPLRTIAKQATKALKFKVSPTTLKRNANFLFEIGACEHELRNRRTIKCSALNPTARTWGRAESFLREHQAVIVVRGYTPRGVQRWMSVDVKVAVSYLRSSLRAMGFTSLSSDDPIFPTTIENLLDKETADG